MRNFVALCLVVLAFIAANHAYKLESRIVDGGKAALGQFPYYAFLLVNTGDPRRSGVCGASLINEEWLLTAAHCLTGAVSVNVHLGGIRLDLNKPTMQVGSSGLYPHPEYIQVINDIALIHLPQKIRLSENIKTIDLPKSSKSPVGVSSIAVGHGKTSDGGDVSMHLNYAKLKTIPLKKCSDVFPFVELYGSYICAQSESNDYQSVCQGDSGGPLVSLEDNTLIGVADFVVKAGCETGSPQGFTNVHSYLGWIEEVIRDHGNDPTKHPPNNASISKLLSPYNHILCVFILVIGFIY